MEGYKFGSYLPIQIRRYIKLVFISGIVYLIFKSTISLCFSESMLLFGLDLLEILFIVIYILCLLLYNSRRKYIDDKRKTLIVEGFIINLIIVLGMIIL